MHCYVNDLPLANCSGTTGTDVGSIPEDEDEDKFLSAKGLASEEDDDMEDEFQQRVSTAPDLVATDGNENEKRGKKSMSRIEDFDVVHRGVDVMPDRDVGVDGAMVRARRERDWGVEDVTRENPPHPQRDDQQMRGNRSRAFSSHRNSVHAWNAKQKWQADARFQWD